MLKRRFGAAADVLDACDGECRMSRGRRSTLPVALNSLVQVFRM